MGYNKGWGTCTNISNNGNNKSPEFYSQYFVVSSILQTFIHVKFQI